MRCSNICLITEDLPRLAHFYEQVTGVRAEGGDIHVELRIAGAGLAIISTAGMEALAPGATSGAGHGGGSIGFEVDDVDNVYERLQVLGVALVKLPKTHPWGARSVWFRDPNGNIISFYAPAK